MKNKAISIALSAVMAIGVCSGIVGCKKAGGPTHFTYYITAGVDGYYRNYEDNPVIEYISENVQFAGEDGEMKNITFDFTVPANTESARSDFSNKYLSGDWENVIDPTMSLGIADLYEDGLVLDLTEYVTDPEIMPNLSKFLSENPDIATLMQVETEDGRKYLSIPVINDASDPESQAFGFNYRRDLIVKYGVQPETFYDPMGLVTDESGEALYKTPTANPDAGKKFGGSFTVKTDGSTVEPDYSNQDTVLSEGFNGDSWVDNVRFPSGSITPIYISDWMWMLQIYETAYEDMGFTGNTDYLMGLFYPGYNANGDFSSGFGGGGVLWYKDEDDNCQFGMLGTGFRAYLECMNDWYERGWIDADFNTNKDAFYEIDMDEVARGNVPIWMGASRAGTRLQSTNDKNVNASGAVVYLAATPINDIPAYDGDPNTTDYSVRVTELQAESAISGGEGSEYMLQIPTCMFQNELYTQGHIITPQTAEDKDLILLLHFFDYLFSEEGSKLISLGLSKSQYEATENEYYEEYGLTEGSYTENADGTYTFALALEQDSDLRNAMTAFRLPGLVMKEDIKYTFPDTYQWNRKEWVKYEPTGWIGGLLGGQCTASETSQINELKASIEENFLYSQVYKFVKGEVSLSNQDWLAFRKKINEYNYKGVTVQNVTDTYNNVFDRVYGSIL